MWRESQLKGGAARSLRSSILDRLSMHLLTNAWPAVHSHSSLMKTFPIIQKRCFGDFHWRWSMLVTASCTSFLLRPPLLDLNVLNLSTFLIPSIFPISKLPKSPESTPFSEHILCSSFRLISTLYFSLVLCWEWEKVCGTENGVSHPVAADLCPSPEPRNLGCFGWVAGWGYE